jgi:hypothetical protein
MLHFNLTHGAFLVKGKWHDVVWGSRPWVVVNGRLSLSTDRFRHAELPFSSDVGGQVNSRPGRGDVFLYQPRNQPQLFGHAACNLVTVQGYAITRMMQ